MSAKNRKKASDPHWTEEERKAAENAFATELRDLTKQIALGRHKGRKRIAEALWAFNRKLAAARHLGITKASFFTVEELHEAGDLVSELTPLVEFCSSPVIREGIFTRLRKALSDLGVEDRFLALVGTPTQRARNEKKRVQPPHSPTVE